MELDFEKNTFFLFKIYNSTVSAIVEYVITVRKEDNSAIRMDEIRNWYLLLAPSLSKAVL